MARKNKTPQTWAKPDASPASESLADVSQVEAEAELPAPAAPAPEVETLDLHDAARRWVPAYQERWWDGIRKHATAMGFGEGGTEEQCKAVLRHWGAKC